RISRFFIWFCRSKMSEEAAEEGTSQTQSTLSPSQVKFQSQSQPGSGSSSGPTSASQSSSGSGTLSSVDTIPVTLPSVPEEPEPEPQPWGRLLPMAQGFRNCIADEYLFGRDSKCSYVFGEAEERGSQYFRTYSKRHFRIFRVRAKQLSSNLSVLPHISVSI
uniref:FHA domain-containing protein n=1 Tax=Oryzias melastigma TaxID=30732 RepID=A0A3B3BAJ9_ORYME